MLNGCDICIPKKQGYTVYFEDQSIDKLVDYFSTYTKEGWFIINETSFWAEESIVFDLIDYLEAHYDTNKIFVAPTNSEQQSIETNDIRPLHTLHVQKETSWVDQLIKKRMIKTHYQPIVSLHNKSVSIVGHELLSRGIDKNGDIISPFKMFEAARVRNKTFALDRVCRMESVKNASKITDRLIFINFIPTAIYVPEHCLSTTFKLIKQIGIKPEQVVFEVVETDEVSDIEHLKRILNYYKSHGFKYALDDVGTGFNDLKKLADLEPNFVKLAREYADGVSTDENKQAVAKSVLQVANEIQSTALAEGVERKQDIDYLSDLGYELFQGYYFGKPEEIPLETVEQNKW